VRRGPAIAVGVVVGLLLVAEVAAVPVATRVLGSVLARCVGFDSFEVVAIDRPVVPRLLVGRASGVELAATGVTAGELRVESAALRLPEAILPWAFGDPEPEDAALDLVVTEADLQRVLRAYAPLGLPLTVQLDDGVARLGASGVPGTVDLALATTTDGGISVSPVAGDRALFERLGIAAELPPNEDARVTALALDDGRASGTVAVQVVPGVGDGDACDEPLEV
jgi:hypothetical protein